LKNGQLDVSGFKFSPDDKSFDGTSNGGFGFVCSVLISQYPKFSITTSLDTAEQTTNTLKSLTSPNISFLGRSLGPYLADKSWSAERHGGAKVAFTFRPNLARAAPTLVDSRAFVLGVKTCFPAA
jgi:hypothetical protein